MNKFAKTSVDMFLGAFAFLVSALPGHADSTTSDVLNADLEVLPNQCADLAPAWLESEARAEYQIKSIKGCASDAEKYYAAISKDLGLPLATGKNATTLDAVLDYLGFAALSANLLETAPPDLLMPADAAAFERLAAMADDPEAFRKARALSDFQQNSVVAVRYFAAKVANYEPRTPWPGWRKLVRVKARDGSEAEGNGIRAGWILFNEVASPKAFSGAPFGINLVYPVLDGPDPTPKQYLRFAYADAIQVILEVDPQELKANPQRPKIYFLSYFGRYAAEDLHEVPYGLAAYLKASFDLSTAYKDHKGRYYVPGACVQCHSASPQKGATLSDSDLASIIGGNLARGLRLNYLDTDQWQDARHSGDFKVLDPFDIPLLIDADPVKDPQAHARVFDRFRVLNTEVLDQNELLDPKRFRIATRSVALWLERHKTDPDYVDRWQRILAPLKDGELAWSKGNPFDEAILPLLERYCSRCHMSMFYGIYNRASVRARAGAALDRVRAADGPIKERYKWMPQGRVLDRPPVQDDMRLLACYLDALKNIPPTETPELPTCQQQP